MTEKRFELQLCSNGTYYVYENGTLTDIDFDKFNKESADALIDEVNALYEENEQLKYDVTVFREVNKGYRKRIMKCEKERDDFLNDLDKLEIAIEMVQKEFENNQEVQEAIKRAIMIKRKLKGDVE